MRGPDKSLSSLLCLSLREAITWQRWHSSQPEPQSIPQESFLTSRLPASRVVSGTSPQQATSTSPPLAQQKQVNGVNLANKIRKGLPQSARAPRGDERGDTPSERSNPRSQYDTLLSNIDMAIKQANWPGVISLYEGAMSKKGTSGQPARETSKFPSWVFVNYLSALDREVRLSSSAVLRIMEDMRANGIKPLVRFHNALMRAYLEERNSLAALQVFESMQQNDATPDVFSFARACMAAMNLNRNKELRQLAGSLREEWAQLPADDPRASSRDLLSMVARVFARMTLMEAEEAARGGAPEQWRLARDWASMQSPPSPETIADLLAVAANADETTTVQVCMRLLEGGHYHVEEGKLLAVMECAARLQQPDLAAKAFHMLSDSLKASRALTSSEPAAPRRVARACTYHALAHAHVGRGQYREAFEVVAALQEAHVGDADAVSAFRGLKFFVAAFGAEDQVARAYKALQDRAAAGQGVSTTMMNVVLRGVARLGGVELAGRAFESFGAMDVAHDTDSFNAVIEACRRDGKLEAAEALYNFMSTKSVPPNEETFSQLLEGYVAMSDMEGVLGVLGRATGAGVVVPEAQLRSALAAARQAGDKMAVEQLTVELEVMAMQRRADGAKAAGRGPPHGQLAREGGPISTPWRRGGF